MIAISFALPAESRNFLREMRQKSSTTVDETRIIDGTVDNIQVVAFHTGVGRKVCASRLDSFFRIEKPRLLISAGFAGSLRDDLNAGNLMLGANFSDSRLLEIAHDVLQGNLVRS